MSSDLPTGECSRCGLEFYVAVFRLGYGGRGHHEAKLCADCRKVARNNTSRGNPVLVLEFGATVATLRLAVEQARARLGMGIHGSQCGRDSLIESMYDADGLMERAQDAYKILAGTRVDEVTELRSVG